MLPSFLWYLTLTLTGWLAFPLAYRLLPALHDRGYALSRALGLLLWGYIFWLMASLGLTRNTSSGILTAVAVMASLSVAAGWKRRHAIKDWLYENRGYVLTAEAAFLLAFAAAVVVRGFIPEAIGTEKPMELAFINAILRSPTFPPHDPWLSGYAISYYYFGYVLVGMLAKLLAVPGTVAFNLGLSTVFALTIVGAFGIAYTLIKPRQAWAALLAPLFVALTGNWEGALEVLHSRGLLSPAFWKWLDIKDMAAAPQAPFTWTPQRFWWWWRASRVVSDHNLRGAFQEVIDEFPFFSYLLGDLHPHVLAYPFALLAIGLALNLYLGGSRRVALFGSATARRRQAPRPHPTAARDARRFSPLPLGEGRKPPSGGLRGEGVEGIPPQLAAAATAPLWPWLRLSWPSLALAAVALGGMAFLNTWDFPIYVGLFAAAYAVRQARWEGWRAQIGAFLGLGLLLGIGGAVLYLPFYIGFSSQAGGIVPNLINPTRGAQLWVMFGPLLVPLFLWLGAEAFRRTRESARGLGWFAGGALGLAFLLWLGAWLLGWLIAHIPPLSPHWAQAGPAFLSITGAASWQEFATAAFRRHFGSPWGTLTLVALLGLAAFLLAEHASPAPRPRAWRREGGFPLLLVIFGALLVLAPNFFYLRDQFGTRMNTVFKFYYQGWLLWGLAAAYGVAWLARQRGSWQPFAQAVWVAALLAGLVYPVLALPNRTNNFKTSWGWTLNAGIHIARQQPDEWAAMQALWQVPLGTVAEAVGGSYTQYARISTYSGQAAVLGWPGHESQWRGGGALFAGRQEDISTLYTTPSWETARQIIAKYDIRYIVVAPLEYNTYPVREDKFRRHLPVLFRQGAVTIYGVVR